MNIKPKRMGQLVDTTANWERVNPILINGEIGIEKCSNGENKIKVGDGMTAWKNLKYISKSVNEIENEIQTAETGLQNQIDNIENEIKTTETGLQNQIDNIVITASGSDDVTAEVAQARVDFDGNGHSTLKNRLDSDFNDLAGRIENTNTAVGGVKNQFAQQTEYSAY